MSPMQAGQSGPSSQTVGPPPAQHRCVMCETELATKQELQDHFRLHANGQIDMKGRNIAAVQAGLMAVEVTVKVEEGPVSLGRTQDRKKGDRTKCDICEETFETPTLAIQHKFRKHRDSQKKYFCGFCGKQFPLEVSKVNHIKSEHKSDKRGPKLYQCKECSAQFFCVEAIEYHVRTGHQRVSSLINPIFTYSPSKKIKRNIAGEANSVFYCHLCGHEYMIKFNLQKHIESQHSHEERTGTPQQIIKCKLCEGIFHNKKAWDSHNLLHCPEDLYIHNEADRRLAVARVDQDFDHSRVPSLLDKLLPVNRVKKGIKVVGEKGREEEQETGEKKEEGRNKAVVDSDSDDDKSDTSIEDEDEEDVPPPKKTKANPSARSCPSS